MPRTLHCLLSMVVALALAPTHASTGRDFSQWLQGIRHEAVAQHISKTTLDTALGDLAPIPRVIELDRQQPESTLSFEQYLQRVVPASRVAKGRARLAENRPLLDAIGRTYGVQPRFIVALWGVESDFGRHTGSYPVVAALATLAHDGRRSAYFRKELLHALHILDEGHITPAEMQGSWAGAMGQNQFMPSSFRRYAVDYDGDGRRDIWGSRGDVLASAANYLSHCGWRDDLTWGREVRLPGNLDRRLIGLDAGRSLGRWQRLGVRRLNGGDLPRRGLRASVVQPDGLGGRAFLVYDNYQALLKWNRSTFFATAVGLLADQLRN